MFLLRHTPMTDASDLSHPHDEGSLSANEAVLCGATALRERPLRGVPEVHSRGLVSAFSSNKKKRAYRPPCSGSERSEVSAHPRSRGGFSLITFVPRYPHAANSACVFRPTTRSRPRLGLVVRCGDLALSQKNMPFCAFFYVQPKKYQNDAIFAVKNASILEMALV